MLGVVQEKGNELILVLEIGEVIFRRKIGDSPEDVEPEVLGPKKRLLLVISREMFDVLMDKYKQSGKIIYSDLLQINEIYQKLKNLS